MGVDLERYFDRIGWTGPRAPTEEVLGGLHLRHAEAIPFENVDVLLRRPIRLDLEALQEKLVAHRRGGYCFEQNTLFAAALRALGFEVTTLEARVRYMVPPEVATPRAHMVLRVELEDGPRLVDVGFGGLGLTAPLRFLDGARQRTHLETYVLERRAGSWLLRAEVGEGPIDVYEVGDVPALPIDYEVANHFMSTHPRSHFTQLLVAARPDVTAGVRYTLRGRELGIRSEHGVERRPLAGDGALFEALRSHFHLEPEADWKLP